MQTLQTARCKPCIADPSSRASAPRAKAHHRVEVSPHSQLSATTLASAMEHAKLDAIIHGKQQCVSFRHASTLLSLPTRSAQQLLLSYLHSQPADKLSALWVVTRRDERTNAVKTVLTASPLETDTKQIWAVGPASASSAPSKHAAWIAHDTSRERDLVKRPSHEPNELRDGRFNVFSSSTNVYDQRIDPRLGADTNLVSRNVTEKKSNSSSFLALVKSKTKGKKSKQAPFSFKNAANNTGSTSSLFSSKRLGADSVRKIKAEERAMGKDSDGSDKMSPPTAPETQNRLASKNSEAGRENRQKKKKTKKTRRIVVQADSDKEGDESEEEMDEEQARMMELEKEAAEEERAAAERAELEKELMDLQGKVDEEPESPVLRDMDAEMKDVNTTPPEPDHKMKDSPNKGKRSYWDTLNHTPVSGRRVRKEIQELVEENGYFVTRRVVKVFDENGNEVTDEPQKDAEMDEAEMKHKEENSASLRRLFTPHKNKKGNRSKPAGANGKPSKPSSPTLSPGKKPKKRKGRSIKSYFTKTSLK
eukprot:TRINITY_DN518_c0_g3_i1.p1 TRINITY_DN518_c0_g3~~TRINITY_DN518_c0_g3_i1.p1  ORF type:complete len:534 (-),score=110.57 TRINITY_DN518_c0_g3_i1:4115-5716(-)